MAIESSLNNIIGSTININSSKDKIPKQLTSKLGKSTIIGREKELKEIDQLLNSSGSLLLINGIGGIGKSTIAGYYLYSQKEKYDYYGFFEGLESFIVELKSRLDIKSEKSEEAFIEALAKLSSLEGNKLLVLDDIKEIEKNQEQIEKILALKDSGYKILLTSREEIEDIEQYYLDVLSIEDAKKLFNSIYKVENEQVLEEVLNYLDYHAFFVEKVAQTLKNKKGLLTLEDIKEKFTNHQFTDIRVKKKESFNQLLKELFTIDKLEENEILLLKQLSVLPSINIELDFLSQIFQVDDRVKFQENLEYLSEKGLLIPNSNGYKLHQIIKEYILENYLPEFHEIKKIFDSIINKEKEYDITKEYILSFYFVMELIEKKKTVFWDFMLKIFRLSIIEKAIFVTKFLVVEKIFDKKLICNEIVKIFNFFNSVANIYFYQGEYKKALKIQKKSCIILERLCGKESNITAISYNNLANLYKSKGEHSKAELLYKKALKIREKILGEEHPDTATSYNNLAALYQSMGAYEKAEPLFKKSLKIREKVLGEEHPHTAISYNNLAALYQSMGDYKKAEPLYKKALEKVLGEEHPDTATSYNNLAALYQSMGAYKKAEPLYKKALKIREKILGEEHPSTAISYNNLAILYNSMGNYKKAEPLYKKSLKIREKILGEEHPDTATSYNNLAELYKSMGDYNKVEPLYKKALKIREKILGENHPNTVRSYNNLGYFYKKQKIYNKAQEFFKKCINIVEKLDYPPISIKDLNSALSEVEKNLKRESGS